MRAAFGNLVWCVRCGAYAVKWAVGLAEKCRGGPRNQSQRRVLTRLRAGKHPRTNQPIGDKIMMEVPGMSVGGALEEGMRVALGRTRAGYLRRPGGAVVLEKQAGDDRRLVMGGGIGSSEWEMEEGPWERLKRRRGRMQLSVADYGAGDGNAAKRQRAYEAREEDSSITEGLVRKWKEAIDLGMARGAGTGSGEVVGGGDVAVIVVEAVGATTVVAGEDGTLAGGRKELVKRLQRAVSQQRGVEAGDARAERGQAGVCALVRRGGGVRAGHEPTAEGNAKKMTSGGGYEEEVRIRRGGGEE